MQRNYVLLYSLNLEKRFWKLNIDITNRIHTTCLKRRIFSQFDDVDALVCESKGCWSYQRVLQHKL